MSADLGELGRDLKTKRELEKKTKDALGKANDELGKRVEDLVEKGVSGEDVSKAMGELERDFKELERKSRTR
jgi:hypothetical protein